MYQQISELQLRPLNVVMKRILDRLGRKDPANIFAKPVSLEEVCIVSFPYHRKPGNETQWRYIYTFNSAAYVIINEHYLVQEFCLL